jgi:hypothetical protein
MDSKIEIARCLSEIGAKNRKRYLVAQEVEKFEKTNNADITFLIDNVKRITAGLGENEAKQHKQSLERWKRINQISMMKYDYGIPGSFIGLCYCFPWGFADFDRSEDWTAILPPGGTGNVSVTWDATKLIAQSSVQVSGTAFQTTEAYAGMRWYFTFDPGKDGTFCIEPIIQLSGHWIIWANGSCPGQKPEVKAKQGEVHVIIRTLVWQANQKIFESEEKVLEKVVSNGTSGFYYDTLTEPKQVYNLQPGIFLEGDHEATVLVEVEIHAQMENYGLALFDMATSGNYYAQVPILAIARRKCGKKFVDLH